MMLFLDVIVAVIFVVYYLPDLYECSGRRHIHQTLKLCILISSTGLELIPNVTNTVYVPVYAHDCASKSNDYSTKCINTIYKER
jgi:hypothetical protein